MSASDDNLMMVHKTVCELAVVVIELARRMGHSDLSDRVDRRLDEMIETWQLEIDFEKGPR